MRGCAGGLLKESPTPPRTFLERITIGGNRRSRPVPAFACALAWRRWLSLPLRCPRGACPVGRLPPPAFSLPACPHPPDPLPGGKGETKVFFMQGASPLASPRLNPGGAGYPCRCGARGGGCPLAALVIPAPGERTISNAEVPLPRSPLSLAAGTAYREQLPVGFAANRGYSPGDARGEAPCIRKLKISPFPPGRGSGGWGK